MDKRGAIQAVVMSAWLAAVVSGCAGSSRSDSEPSAKKPAVNEKAEPACHWDARLDRGDDAPRGACHAKRSLLSCAMGGGSTAICISNESQCEPDAGETGCKEHCKADEYAIACGAVGPDTGNPDPPAACHDMSATPAGVFFMCCPCE
jgi:hypothetical protein